MRRRPLWLVIALWLWPLISQATDWPPAVMHYLQELHAIEAASQPRSMEALFTSAGAVQDEVMLIRNDLAWLETLSDSDFNTLSGVLHGIRLSRGYDIYAQPDPEALLQLAQVHGREEDRAFFAVYRRSWGEDLIPTYLRQTSRIAPCVRFGEGVIAELYAAWTKFHAKYPTAYPAYVEQSIADLEEAVTLGTCACGNEDSVEQELSSFLSRFPDTPARTGILGRLQQLEDDPDRRPVRCR